MSSSSQTETQGSFGFTYNTSNLEAVIEVERGILSAQAYRGNAIGHFGRAASLDPSFAFPQILREIFKFVFHSYACILSPDIRRQTSTRLHALMCNERDRIYIRVYEELTAGHVQRGIVLLESLILSNPRDVYALKILGKVALLFGEFERWRLASTLVVSNFPQSSEIYPFLLGNHAFVLEETGRLDDALKSGLRAIELNPHAPWTIHAVAHVYEELNQPEEGISFVMGLEHYWRGSYLACHIYWHLAVFRMSLKQFDQALAVYDDGITKFMAFDKFFPLLDGISLLWRLQLEGVELGEDRVDHVAGLATKALAINHHKTAFFDCHLVMGLSLKTNDPEKAVERAAVRTELLEQIEAFVQKHEQEDQHIATVSILRQVGLPVCHAVSSLAESRCDEAVHLLLPLRHSFTPLGGSHAQRDLFLRILLRAALKGFKLLEATHMKSDNLLQNKTFVESLIGEARLSNPHSAWLKTLSGQVSAVSSATFVQACLYKTAFFSLELPETSSDDEQESMHIL